MADAIPLETIQQALSSEIESLLALDAGTIKPDTYLPPLGIDSLRFVSLLLMIEQKFGVNLMKGGIGPEDTKTVLAFSALILNRRNG